jgi:ferrous iron transport protein A
MRLNQLHYGQTARILAVEGGHGLRRRLQRMGIHAGDTISLSSHGAFRGPLLITVHGAQIALGHGVARRILVEPLGSPRGRSR